MLAPEELGWDLGLYAQDWLTERLRVTRRLARAVMDDPTIFLVHRLRVSCRRLREAAAFFAGAPELPRLVKAGRSAKRMMGVLQPIREVDVARTRLRALGGRPLDAEAESSREALLERLERRRRRLAKRRRGRIRRRAKRLLSAIAGATPREAVRPPPPAGAGGSSNPVEGRTREFLESRMAERRAAVERLTRQALAPGATEERLHDVRVAVKHWRYANEIGRPAVARESYRPLSVALGRLHEGGGLSQDLADLVRRLEKETLRAGGKRRRGFERLLQVAVAEREAASDEFREALRTTLATAPLSSRLSRPTETRMETRP